MLAMPLEPDNTIDNPNDYASRYGDNPVINVDHRIKSPTPPKKYTIDTTQIHDMSEIIV